MNTVLNSISRDLLHAARHTPIITFERRMDLAAVVAARKAVPHPPAWALIFAKDVPDPENFGVVVYEDGRVVDIVEKAGVVDKRFDAPPTNEAVVGLYCFPPDVFDVIELINHEYPRGGMAAPGLTAGACLRKDFTFSEERSSAPGMLLAVSDYVAPVNGERPFRESVRYRTVGDLTITGAVRSSAATLPDVVTEIAATTVTERGQTRADDRTSEAAMEDRKREGYF